MRPNPLATVLVSPLVVSLVASSFLAPASLAGQSGERWEYTTKMQSAQMQGFAMPAMTVQVCNEPGWKTPPKGQQQDSDCAVQDYQKSGNKMSWRVECPNGKGRGEMTLAGSDAFTGFTEFSTDQGQFRMDMTGRKIGSCDPASDGVVVNGMNLPNAAQMQQHAAGMSAGMAAGGQNPQLCGMALQQMQPFLFKAGAPCAAQQAAFCARLKGDGGKQLASTDPSGEMAKMAQSICAGK